jgi:hypothetical protein
MPALHPTYACHVCKKTHALYLPHGTVPDLFQQLFYVCPKNGFAIRVTVADGWNPVEGVKPAGALEVYGTELANRAES